LTDELITIFDGFPTIEIRKSNDFVTEVWVNDRLVCEYTYPDEDESINNIKWEEEADWMTNL